MDSAIDNLQINAFNNRKIVISTKQGTPFRIQFPRMYMPFGVSGFTPEVGQTKYNIDFAIKGYDEEESYMKKFYDSTRKIEDMIIDAVVEQSENIFGSPMMKEDLLPMFNSNIKQSPDREPKFRVRLIRLWMTKSKLTYLTRIKTRYTTMQLMDYMQEIRDMLSRSLTVCIS